jgi:hypothetical protein
MGQFKCFDKKHRVLQNGDIVECLVDIRFAPVVDDQGRVIYERKIPAGSIHVVSNPHHGGFTPAGYSVSVNGVNFLFVGSGEFSDFGDSI